MLFMLPVHIPSNIRHNRTNVSLCLLSLKAWLCCIKLSFAWKTEGNNLLLLQSNHVAGLSWNPSSCCPTQRGLTSLYDKALLTRNAIFLKVTHKSRMPTHICFLLLCLCISRPLFVYFGYIIGKHAVKPNQFVKSAHFFHHQDSTQKSNRNSSCRISPDSLITFIYSFGLRIIAIFSLKF